MDARPDELPCLELANVSKSFGAGRVLEAISLKRWTRRVRCVARTFGLRQEYDPAHDRRHRAVR